MKLSRNGINLRVSYLPSQFFSRTTSLINVLKLGVVMQKFIVRDKELIHCPTNFLLADVYLRSVVLENNNFLAFTRDEMRQGTILHCDNKPRDLPIYGIYWELLTN